MTSPRVARDAATLVALLQQRAQGHPNRLAFRFLTDGDNEEITVTYAELDRRARAIAATLQGEEVVGRRALLLFPPGLDFVEAFFGCLYAGIVAVPAYPPRLNRPSPRIQRIVTDAGATLALTTERILEKLSQRFEHMPELEALHWLDTEKASDEHSKLWREPGLTGASLAFLQYTSGSTSEPKGVMVSHGNLLHNLETIRRGFQIDTNAIGVFWLPSYHDMGLIGGILEPMYVKGPATLMAPTAFLQRPVRWLQAISRYGGTISGAPNFAYQMCVDKVTPDQCEGLDLSSWDVAFCGAEPIQIKTLEAFADKFARYGFRRDAFYPCYGLAEATLLVACGDGPSTPTTMAVSVKELGQNRAVPIAEAKTDDSQTLVSCGRAFHGQQIIIADPETGEQCAPGAVGEIWVAGPSIAQGYWQRPRLTEETFTARLAGGAGPFLRTGDLGFVYDDELYVTGRIKDLIIIRGRNYYPTDIEQAVAASHEAFEVGMGAAFSVPVGGEEQLVITYELRRSHRRADVNEVAETARSAVASAHGLTPYAILLLKPLSIPRTSSGKIKRGACRQGYLDGTLDVIGEWQRPAAAMLTAAPEQARSTSVADRPSPAEIEQWLVSHVASLLQIPAARVDSRRPFVDLGLDSVQAVELAAALEGYLGRELPPTLVWDYPTIVDMASHLGASPADRAQTRPDVGSGSMQEPIAIIGLGCRFPGAAGPDAFWQLLANGVDAIREVPADRWNVDALHDGEGEDGPAAGKMSSRWGGFLNEIDRFDAHFFGISPREAARMDPQQRLLLEIAWEALEHAGQAPARLAGSPTGVFVGISSYDYSRLQFGDPELIDAYAGTGNAHSIAANRLSYALDLWGPSMAIDTACSSSLVAVHLAVQSLRQGECTLALAGGVNLLVSPELSITFSQARMMAADGRCKTFDARADGYGRGEGGGMIVLKRLSDAERDGDRILAVVRGSAVNQDGRSNGLTAPNGRSQQAVIRRALADAQVAPADLDYVEAHGTGTPLGDPIEVHSLRAVLEADGGRQDRCWLGSVKTNVGHLEAAAGIAGLIKTILALEHETIPAHLHFTELNPHIKLHGSQLAVAATAQPWPRGERPRVAGVSSFGFGGTNAHVIVGDSGRPAARPAKGTGKIVHLLPLSARSEPALRALVQQYTSFLTAESAAPARSIARTAATGRDHFDFRLAVAGASPAELGRKLAAIESLPAGRGAPPRIAFLFTGQGAQYGRMGRDLYATEPVFRGALDRCAHILQDLLPKPLLQVLGYDGRETDDAAASAPLDQTIYTQPALFSLEYALACLWRSWGIEPEFVLGHSVGEYVAAHLAGVFSLEDALRLVAARARMMQALPAGGAMAVVFAGEERVAQALVPFATEASIAAINGPENVTISGTAATIAAITAQMEGEGIEARRLTVSHAFHSPLMEPILAQFAEVAGRIDYSEPRLTLIGNETGTAFASGALPDADYWQRHIRQPVRFADGMEALASAGATAFVEIGPQPHLLGMGRLCLPDATSDRLWLPSLRRDRAERETILESLGVLYAAGCAIDWEAVFAPHPALKVALPTYPFQRERHWLDIEPPVGSLPTASLPAGVRRLQTALPIYEARLDAASKTSEAAWREVVQVAARDFWGTEAVKVTGLAVSDRNEVARIQVAVAAQSASVLTCQLFHYDAPRAVWRPVGTAQVERESGPRTELEAPAAVATTAPLAERLQAAPPEAQSELLAGFLQAAVAAVLGLDKERVGPHQPLDSLGLDSLMALELRRRVEAELALELPVVALLQGPTIAELAGELQLRFEAGPRLPAIMPRETPVEEPLPLSHGQEAMWFLHQLLPPDISFNVAGAARLLGPLDAEALRHALAQVILRHPALRTVFKVEGGTPVQLILAEPPLPLTEEDASTWDEARLQAFLEQEAHRPFDLASMPPLRVILLQRDVDDHILLLAISHIVADFWSAALIVRELSTAYALATGLQAQPLSSVSALDFGDYALWQRQLVESDEGDRLRAYWLEQLDGELPLLDLPTDRPRPAQQTFRGDTVSHRLSATLTGALQRLGQDHGTTLATTLLTGFLTLLHRYGGQDDLVVGSVLAGRDRPELADLVGYFVNPVAVRASVGKEMTFADFLQQVRQTMLDAYEHQAFPLPLLAQELSLARDPSRPPLFETMFIMQQAHVLAEQGLSAFALGLPGARMELGELQIESVALRGLPAQLDLTLMMAEIGDELVASLHYNTALFSEETAVRMLRHLEALLAAAVADPWRQLARLPLLPQSERRQLLGEWNQTEASYPHNAGLHELFARQAGRTPEKVAVVYGDETLTYAQLNERANQLAHFLQARGVGPDVLVGVGMERSPEMVVALLGVLKAGGAYVPLDPDFPPARLGLMLEDAQPALLLTKRASVEAGVWDAAPADMQLVSLDADWPIIAGYSREDPRATDDPENLAYVIYTSGSTGRPKGVAIPHRAVVNFLYAMREQPGLACDDVLLAVTTLSFDIAVLELYLPLVSGARVVIAPADVAADGVRLAALLDESDATVMQATPATWRLLLAAGWTGKPNLKILCGGEALPRDLADALLARSAELWNMYGPTETTVWSTTNRVAPGTGAVSIGRPIANTQIYILDDALQPVPVGVVGDLYIGGDGVARGYYGQPELTTKQFIPDPFATPPSSGRLYKTGDLARFSPDGSILFLGRRDHQVKVRGFRIELGDIETALLRHEAIQEAVVVARGDGASRRLIAFFVSRERKEEPETVALRQFLGAQLPDYMVPSLFVRLDSLPLTPNNKINRRALPEPPRDRAHSATPYQGPRDALEEQLVALVGEVLSVPVSGAEPTLGIHDDFFDLGGNSLLATRLIYQVRAQLDVDVSLRHLFVDPTVAGLAAAVTATKNGSSNGHSSLSLPTTADLNSEATLDPLITVNGSGHIGASEALREVMLTGATGFVGAFLLRDLLHETEARIHCLVRADDTTAGLDRVRRNLEQYGLWQSAFARRIEIVPGDLAQPLLGLPHDRFVQLGAVLDAIYHNGALVNFVYPYAAHKRTNVDGTQEVLRLAASGRLQPVHFVSTLSVFHTGAHDDGSVFTEDDDLDAAGTPFGGYAQSKWVAEKLVLEAGRRGIPVTIYRPGLVTADSSNGVWNTDDMLSTLTRLSLTLKAAPDLNIMVDVVPVDYVSAAIVHLSQQASARGRVYHLNNPAPLAYADLIRWAQNEGLALETIPFTAWREQLAALVMGANGAGNPFLPLLQEVTDAQVFMPRFDCRHTLRDLEGSGVSCPPVDETLLQVYLGRLRAQGLLPAPQASDEAGRQ